MSVKISHTERKDLIDFLEGRCKHLLNINLDIQPTVRHRYDHRCRCIDCQYHEFDLQNRIEEEKKHRRK